MVQFLESLGVVKKGARPDFDVEGFWLYDDSNKPVVHISPASETSTSLGTVDHLAFRSDRSVSEITSKLEAHGVQYRGGPNPVAGVHQLKVNGPEGLILELLLPLE